MLISNPRGKGKGYSRARLSKETKSAIFMANILPHFRECVLGSDRRGLCFGIKVFSDNLKTTDLQQILAESNLKM